MYNWIEFYGKDKIYGKMIETGANDINVIFFYLYLLK